MILNHIFGVSPCLTSERMMRRGECQMLTGTIFLWMLDW